ncbi:MAG: AbrB/MazE/SpoVT family DNA-binding domain-containing protein [Canidatus Methanoxibalbensis ujae]|nr:AbrB/MazE/SpoVT family DNA-binding domain-containing protein [Candidatus Methanoxibalbensis ujae]MCW7079212.1 AbrB/MazE/SpoVT family DNA-binding domain-containing protein [Candidatus Methanoxibalbensis ujae]
MTEEGGRVKMRREKRRIQLTGGSTYIISLPIKWVKELGIKKGDEMLLLRYGRNTLLLMPERGGVEGGDERIMRRVEFKLSDREGFEENLRYLIALYLVGYDEIKLLAEHGFNAEERKRIKEEVRKRLIGMEVVGESSTEIQLQSFLKYEDFTLCDAIKRMRDIVLAMLEDALSAIENHDINLAKDVMERDNEIDRFYLLIVRQLKAIMSDYELSQKIGIGSPRNSLGYRIIVKSIERIGDHIENIAFQSIINEIIPEERISMIRDIGDHVKKVFADVMESLSEMDMKRSNSVIKETDEIVKHVEEAYESVLTDKGDMTVKIHVLSILESLARISKYCADIAEVTINMCIKSAEEEEF